MPARATIGRFVAAVALLGIGLLLRPAPATAAEVAITSAGPLTQIITTTDLNCQVAHRDDTAYEFYPSGSTIGSCGTFLAVNGALYGPAFVPSGNSYTSWTSVSQAPVAGSGSQSDPFRVVTVVDASGAGLRLEQVDSYAVGSQSYRTEMRITNLGPVAQTGVLYRAGDCFLQESDVGFGRVDGGAPACIVSPADNSRIEQWLPITPGSHFIEASYVDVFAAIDTQRLFPDTCACDFAIDNGAGLSWPVTVAPGQTVVVAHETFFSPVGRTPVQQSFRDSVPDPTRISLDPIVIAQSVAITAGVVMLVPFPSALFNNTLEENYDEVMAGLARVRLWFAGVWVAIVGWIKRFIAERRRPPGPSGGQPASPYPPLAREAGAFGAPVGLPPEFYGQAPLGTEAPRLPSAEPPSAPPVPAAAAPPRSQMDLWRTPLGIVGFILLTALLYAFLDPTFGFSLDSLATLAGLAVGLFVVLLAYGLPLVLLARSNRLALTIRALPATLLVGILCVVISRLADFQPGYLYGLIVGFIFARNVDHRQEGRAEAAGAAASLVAALVAWVVLALLRGSPGQGDLGTALLEAATVTIVVAGLENAVFALLPLRFLPGAAVFNWNRRVWLVLIGLGLFGFAHVLLNPSAGYLADTTRTSFFTLVALLVLFGLASVLFWAWFRFRPRRPAPA